jgi:hypothetical protein
MDWTKFTLRDLWHMFDEEEAQRWREKEVQRYRQPRIIRNPDPNPDSSAFILDGYTHDGNHPQGGLRDIFKDKWNKIDGRQGLQQIFNADEWKEAMDISYFKHKYRKAPPKTI